MKQVAVPVLSPTTSAASTHTFRACLFAIAGELFAIDLRYVREVFPIESVTPVPKMPSVLVGVANLRGTVMPLVDMRPALGLLHPSILQKLAVVIKHGSQQAGLMIDDVPEIRTVSADALLTPPTQPDRIAQPFIAALLPIDGKMGGLIEVPTLFSIIERG
ncbi:MAG: chemotaxis protein CheW [Nitrospiraceae bacterium]